eukprot:4681311-Amphidinium_carterae.1
MDEFLVYVEACQYIPANFSVKTLIGQETARVGQSHTHTHTPKTHSIGCFSLFGCFHLSQDCHGWVSREVPCHPWSHVYDDVISCTLSALLRPSMAALSSEVVLQP